jgi:demethylmenaquinone methyltransferase/2-methoxy-6-polyprenyl-1,4-benzoquinol methylase
MSQAPLPQETKYWTRAEDRQRVVNAFFDRSAVHYDRACDIMSMGSGQTYRASALARAGLAPGMRVLDVGTGTGLLAREVVRAVGKSGTVIGVDPSRQMMLAGRRHFTIPLVQAVGECLPFPDGHFDFITMGYALRHVPDLQQTFREYLRVLRPEGRVLLLEITRPASLFGTALARVYFGTLVPLLAQLGTRSRDAAQLMTFYWDTIEQCVAPEVVLASLSDSGFLGSRTVIHGIFTEYTASRLVRGTLVTSSHSTCA